MMIGCRGVFILLLMELRPDSEILARLKLLRPRSHVRIVLGRPKAQLADEMTSKNPVYEPQLSIVVDQ